jgi:hypothetical protein
MKNTIVEMNTMVVRRDVMFIKTDYKTREISSI